MRKSEQNLYAMRDVRNNRLHLTDRSFHDWYRFVLSFPPHLVRSYIDHFALGEGAVILDPFCGTGTTLVEAKKNRLRSVGIEAAPMAHFASRVKVDWGVDFELLKKANEQIYAEVIQSPPGAASELRRFTDDQYDVILKNSISTLPLHKCLVLLDAIEEIPDARIRDVCKLALADVAVHTASNLRFGPEVGVQRKKKDDAPVFEDWYLKVSVMAGDLEAVRAESHKEARCLLVDARNLRGLFPEACVDAVITSPPYPNEKDYTRTTRLESALLGFIRNRQDLRALKQTLLRSNTRNVYVSDSDDALIEHNSRVDRIAQEIECRRIALGKTSGFERLYPRVTRLYFGGMRRHFEELKPVLKPGARLAYVVGDQASYLQVLIRTGELLAEIASDVGYDVIGLDLFRTRLSTATGDQLREEVLLLRWNGGARQFRRNGMADKRPRYDQLIEEVFFRHYVAGDSQVEFERDEFADLATDLGIDLPKNLGDIIYSYRYRRELPARIRNLLDEGEEWIIRSGSRGKYAFVRSMSHRITPTPRLARTKILDATPEIIRRYALNDEQALLAILRYNRLIDVFLGITCYSLQSHLRTTAPGVGQVETDELYVGVNSKGTQFVVPVQAKGKSDQIGIVQIEQDFAICEDKFSNLACRPIAAQFIEDNLIALFEFSKEDGEVVIFREKHYLLVSNDQLSDEEIRSYASE